MLIFYFPVLRKGTRQLEIARNSRMRETRGTREAEYERNLRVSGTRELEGPEDLEN